MKASVIVLLIGGLVLAGEPPAAAEKDNQALQGAWEVTAAEFLKKEMKPLKGTKAAVAEDKLTIGTDKERAYSFTLDPSRKPKEIDLYRGNQLVSRCIYTLDGDELRLCFGPAQYQDGILVDVGERPTTFDSHQGELLTLRRQPKKR